MAKFQAFATQARGARRLGSLSKSRVSTGVDAQNLRFPKGKSAFSGILVLIEGETSASVQVATPCFCFRKRSFTVVDIKKWMLSSQNGVGHGHVTTGPWTLSSQSGNSRNKEQEPRLWARYSVRMEAPEVQTARRGIRYFRILQWPRCPWT